MVLKDLSARWLERLMEEKFTVVGFPCKDFATTRSLSFATNVNRTC